MEIIKTPFRLSLALSLVLANASAADLTLHKVPAVKVTDVPAFPQNLARYHLGAQIQATPTSQPIAQMQLSANGEDKNVSEAALLCDDPTVGYGVPVGQTTLLVSLAKVENVGSVAFLNAGAKGEVTIAAANAKLPADSPQWHTLVKQELAGDLQAEVGPSEAKYVKLTFNLTQPGRIAGFGVYATPQISEFTMPRVQQWAVQEKSDSFALISYSLNDIHAKARALYVSSGTDTAAANKLIDGQVATSYSFAAEDGAPAAVIDLGKNSTVRRLSAIYAPRAGRMEFYVLSSLPGVAASTGETQTAPSELTLNDETFASLKPVGAVTDDGTNGRAAIDFPAVAGRYVLVRWTPAAAQQGSFALAEVAAFGAAGKNGTLLAANTNTPNEQDEYAQTDGKTMIDGKTMVDGKTMIDGKTMAEEVPASPGEAPLSPGEGPPPSLPQPPPFTFVPVMVPISP